MALCLDACGADVTCRRLRLDDRPYEPPARLKELLAKPHRRADVCLQVMLPHQMRPHADLPTAGYFFWETSHFRSSSWARHLNRLSGIIIPAGNTRNACLASQVTVPIHQVPTPVDVSRYERSYEPLPSLKRLRGDAFVFYTIGEFTPRKNLKGLLGAYYTEFSRSENVHFVVKTGKPGVPYDEFAAEFARWNDMLFASLKLHRDPARYPPVTLVNQDLTDEEILRLHASADCYASASHGEGLDLPARDAMALGRTPITPQHTGYLDWSDDSVGWPYPATPVGCSGVIDSFVDLYRADEEWWQPDTAALRRQMRAAFTEASLRKVKAKAGLGRAYRYSYESVGPRLLEVLGECAKKPTGRTCATST